MKQQQFLEVLDRDEAERRWREAIDSAPLDTERVALGDALGRVLAVYEANPNADVETLELKLDEAILKETPALERGATMIKVLSAVAPLLGLLGTVTGMIEVFEVMAISGSGNPRSMASGVSKSTIPTMSGMVAALSGIAMSTYLQRKASRERELITDHLVIKHV